MEAKPKVKIDDVCPTAQSLGGVHAPPARAPRTRPVKEKLVLSWSGGKDSSLALYHLWASQRYEVVALMTTVTEGYDRISMHGVRKVLLDAQVESIGIPLHQITLPQFPSNDIYEAKMREAMAHFKSQGVTNVGFGDLFLEDLKRYRDERLAQAGMKGVYPLWMRDTEELARTFIHLGFKGYLACVDTKALDGKFAGRPIDESLLRELPETVDPCGEYGEYHSYVYAGPIFKKPIACHTGERVLRDGRFMYCDILPGPCRN